MGVGMSVKLIDLARSIKNSIFQAFSSLLTYSTGTIRSVAQE